MASILNVDQINNAAGTTALSIDSSGRITMPNKPHVSVEFDGTTAYLSHSAFDPIKFSNVYEGDSNLYNTSTYKFTCPVDGVYLAVFQVLIPSVSSVDIGLYRNSTLQGRVYIDNARGLGNSFVVDCSANDELSWNTIGAESFYQGTGGQRYSWATYTLIG